MYTKKQFKSSLIAASLSTAFASSFTFAQDISGTVVDEQGNIVAGALIEIKGSDKKQKTDAQGNFLFSDLGLSNVELHISAPKYAHKYEQLTHGSEEDQKNITVALSPSSIEVIDVYATPLHTSTIESAIPVNVLSGEELKRKQASTLGSTLKNEVGIHQTYYGSVTSSPIIRGLDGPRVMITQNGLDSGDASRVGADHTVATETSTATQVEVLRGPATLFYGSGAIGGVVNVVDNRVPKSSDTEVEWLLQHNTGASEDQGSLALQTGTENIAFHVDGFFRNSDNYILPKDFVNDDEHNPEHSERLENSDSKSSGFNIGTSYLLDDGFVGFSYGYLSKDYGIPGHHHHHEEDHDEHHDDHDDDHDAGHDDHEGEERVAAAMEQSRYQVLSEINFQQSFIEKLATKIAYTDYQHQEIENGHVGTTFSNESVEAKFDLTHQNIAGWHGAWTLHYKHADFEAIGEEAFTPPSNSEMIAAAWLEEKHFGNVLLQLGTRVEHVSISADDSYIGFHDDHKELVSFETQDFTPVSASVGLVYDYSKGYNLGLATSFSQRAPSAAELFSFGPHIGSQAFEIGAMFELEEEINSEGEEELHVELSADKPSIETSYNIDLTWRKFEGDFGFVVSAFYNRIDDFYYQQDTGHHFEEDHEEHGDEHHEDDHEEGHGDEEHEDGLPILVYQQNDVEMYGLEAEFAYQITSDFSAKLFGDVIKTKLIGGEEDG
ncbi:MAG: TonB-dependent receptor, partial [Colwellia sp.]